MIFSKLGDVMIWTIGHPEVVSLCVVCRCVMYIKNQPFLYNRCRSAKFPGVHLDPLPLLTSMYRVPLVVAVAVIVKGSTLNELRKPIQSTICWLYGKKSLWISSYGSAVLVFFNKSLVFRCCCFPSTVWGLELREQLTLSIRFHFFLCTNEPINFRWYSTNSKNKHSRWREEEGKEKN